MLPDALRTGQPSFFNDCLYVDYFSNFAFAFSS